MCLRFRLLLGLAAALAACGDSSGGETDSSVFDAVPLAPTQQLDVLFVIDNSSTSFDLQANLIAAFPSFSARLAERFGGALPDVHVGVISGTVGIGGFSLTGCDGDGDDGRLLNQPRGMCDAPTGRWLADAPDGAGGRDTNFTGSLAAGFECIAELGVNGCGFQQHLEAIRRALDGRHADNAGFVRDGAILAVIIVADDDDCSAVDSTVYDPDASATVGPLSTFRCARYGWLCDGQELASEEGTYTDCVPRTDSYLVDPSATVSFLQELKQDPRMVVAAGLFPDRTPVVVRLNQDGEARHDNICAQFPHSTNIRDRSVVDALGGVWVDGCDAALGDGMTRVADHIANRMGAPPP